MGLLEFWARRSALCLLLCGSLDLGAGDGLGKEVPPTLGEFPRHFDGDDRSANVDDSESESGQLRGVSKSEVSVMQAGGGR